MANTHILWVKQLESYISAFEKNYPKKSGLIHADLHPNNFIYHKDGCAVIDFDDCGVGLYGYDLAVAMFAFEYIAEAEKNITYESLKEALFSGYSEHMPFEQCDLDMSSNFACKKAFCFSLA